MGPPLPNLMIFDWLTGLSVDGLLMCGAQSPLGDELIMPLHGSGVTEGRAMTARDKWGCRRVAGALPPLSALDGERPCRGRWRARGVPSRLLSELISACMCMQDALNVQGQKDAQKRKIADDIHKLVSRPAETVELLGNGYLVSRWPLPPPDLRDKALITPMARAKSLKTRSDIPLRRPVRRVRDRGRHGHRTIPDSELTGPTGVQTSVSRDHEEDVYVLIRDGVAARAD